MRRASIAVIAPLFIFALVISSASTNFAQNREKFVISARAGGVNAVTGRATMRGHGNTEWEQLSIKEDLETGDVVRTGSDGRVEMLLNPGSYLRIGENSEFELADSSLANLEVRLLRGTAILEVTGAEDTDLLINVSTPHTRLAIVRRGLYRVNVVPGDNTELIVRKGRVMLDSHTKINGGNKMVFSNNTPSIAKLEKADKEKDNLEDWSKDRSKTLAKANDQLSGKTLNAFRSSFGSYWPFEARYNTRGVWFFRPGLNCYTFLPFTYGWGSPYGSSYNSFFWGGYGWRNYGWGGNILGYPGGRGSGASSGGSGGGRPPGVPSPSFPAGSGSGMPSRGERKSEKLP